MSREADQAFLRDIRYGDTYNSDDFGRMFPNLEVIVPPVPEDIPKP